MLRQSIVSGLGVVLMAAVLGLTGCGSSSSGDKMGGKMDDKMGGKMDDKMGGKMMDDKMGK